MTTAGHEFDPITHRCTLTNTETGNVCGRHELDLLPYADDSYLDQPGIAHVGKLYQREIEELKQLKARWTARVDAGFNRATAVAVDAALEAEAQRADEPEPYDFICGLSVAQLVYRKLAELGGVHFC